MTMNNEGEYTRLLARSFSPIVVTGASGFIGNCAVRRLMQEGCEVHVLLRAEAQMWRLYDLLDRITIHRVDLCDGQSVRAALEKISPQTILHAATHGAYEWQSDARRILETNVLGTFNLLEAALAVHAKIFISTGTSSEYGYKDQPMSEADRLEPNSIYAIAKATQTHLCCLLAKNSPMSIVAFRLFSIYGPWEEPKRLMPILIRRARAGLPLELSSPNTARDFIYVDDLLDILLDFARMAALNGEIINLGSGVQSTLREVVEIVQEVVGARSEVRWNALSARKWDAKRWQAEISKARALLGWSSQCTLREGVRRMAEWMEEHGEEIYERRESYNL